MILSVLCLLKSAKFTRFLVSYSWHLYIVIGRRSCFTCIDDNAMFVNDSQYLFGAQTLLAGTLNLRSNMISGTIPSEIGLMRRWRSIDWSQNRIEGKLPSEIAHMTEIEKMNLSENRLEGFLPTELHKMSGLRESGYA